MKVCKMKVALIVLLVSCTVGAWGNNNNNGNNNNGNNGNNGNHNNLNIWVPGGDTYHYCRGQIYDPYSQMCCGGAVHSKQPWIRCCVDTKWAGKYTKTYSTLSHKCVNGAVWNNKLKCGRTYYTPDKYFCANGNLYSHQEFALCSGNVYRKY